MYKFINLNIWLKLFLVLLVVFTYGLALIPIVLLFMALSSPKKAINEIINGLDTELQSFKLSWIGSMAGLGKLFTEALNCRPELMFVYNGYNINYRKGAFGGMSDIEILPEYETKYIGFDKSRVIKDEGSFDVMIELGKQKKQEDATGDVSSFELLIVSKNHGRIWQDLNANDERVYELLEGLVKYEADHFTRENCIYTAFIISFTYKRNAAQIRTMRISQENEAARLQDYLFGKKQLPPFIKIWLAFSYIQQNVEYDSAYVRAMMAGATMGTESETAFGALINKRATSRGIAEALALILEKAGVECLEIKGNVVLPNSENEYYWNMAKIGSTYYHIDAVWHIENRGVDIGRFMKCDREFMREHKWNMDKYPTARIDYMFDDIELYIGERKNELWAANINKQLLEPMIVE